MVSHDEIVKKDVCTYGEPILTHGRLGSMLHNNIKIQTGLQGFKWMQRHSKRVELHRKKRVVFRGSTCTP